jgi:hypothetical protein
MKQISVKLLVVALIVLVTGCAGMPGTKGASVKKEAFSKPQKLAVVMVDGSVTGFSNSPIESSAEKAKILTDQAMVCMNELGKASNFHLAPEKSVLSSKAYAAIKNDGAGYFSVLSSGYKSFKIANELSNLKALAAETKVDGFIFLNLNYATEKGGIGGFAGIKPVIMFDIKSVNLAGEETWSDSFKISGEDGIREVMGFSDSSKLIPKLNALTISSCQQTQKTLAEKVAQK